MMRRAYLKYLAPMKREPHVSLSFDGALLSRRGN